MATISIPRTEFLEFWIAHIKGQSSKDKVDKFLKYVLTVQPEFSVPLPLQMYETATLEHELTNAFKSLSMLWTATRRSKKQVLKSSFILNPAPLVFLKEKKECSPRKSKSSDAELEILDLAVKVLKRKGLQVEAKLLKGWLNRLSK